MLTQADNSAVHKMTTMHEVQVPLHFANHEAVCTLSLQDTAGGTSPASDSGKKPNAPSYVCSTLRFGHAAAPTTTTAPAQKTVSAAETETTEQMLPAAQLELIKVGKACGHAPLCWHTMPFCMHQRHSLCRVRKLTQLPLGLYPYSGHWPGQFRHQEPTAAQRHFRHRPLNWRRGNCCRYCYALPACLCQAPLQRYPRTQCCTCLPAVPHMHCAIFGCLCRRPLAISYKLSTADRMEPRRCRSRYWPRTQRRCRMTCMFLTRS